MKMFRTMCSVAITVALVGAITSASQAAVIAADNASNADYNDGWQNGDGTNTGFGAWANVVGSDDYKGNFLGDSTSNGGGGGGGINTIVGPDLNASTARSWGTYARTNSLFDANRTMPAMAAGNVFSISMDTGYINGPGDAGPDGSVGFNLRTSGFTDRLSFFFKGGDTDYFLFDGSGFVDTGVAFTDAGLNLAFTLTGADTYSLAITPVGGSTTTKTGTLAGSGSIEDLRVFNFSSKLSDGTFAPSDQFFNSLTLDAIPEPATVTLVGLGMLGLVAFARRRK